MYTVAKQRAKVAEMVFAGLTFGCWVTSRTTHVCTHEHTPDEPEPPATRSERVTHCLHSISGHSQWQSKVTGLLQKVCKEGEGGLVEVGKEVVQR